MSNNIETMNRGYGVMIIEAINSNANGDPDADNDPRTDSSGYGMITGVSIHRKLRDLVSDKSGPAWEMVSAKFDIKKESFDILEERGRDRTAIAKMKPEEIKSQYWDARIFGCTFLEQGSRHINTGVVHFPVGRSVSPVDIQRLTLTNKSGVQEDKDQGMAPMAFRVVSHGVYVVPFHVNPVQAHKTGCTPKDIEVMLALLPYVYSAHESLLRSQVYIHHIWYAEHKNPLGSCPEHLILNSLLPVKRENVMEASRSIQEYDIPTSLSDYIMKRLTSFGDKMVM